MPGSDAMALQQPIRSSPHRNAAFGRLFTVKVATFLTHPGSSR